MPPLLTWFGYAVGVAAIFSVIFFTMLLWLLWIAVASVSLYLATRSEVATARKREPLPSS